MTSKIKYGPERRSYGQAANPGDSDLTRIQVWTNVLDVFRAADARKLPHLMKNNDVAQLSRWSPLVPFLLRYTSKLCKMELLRPILLRRTTKLFTHRPHLAQLIGMVQLKA